MFGTVRARLTLWHTLVLGLILALFAGLAYLFIVQTSRSRTDGVILDALSDLRTDLVAERARQSSTPAAAAEVMGELRFRRIAFVVFDSTGKIVSASVPQPRSRPGEAPEPLLDPARLGRLARAWTPAEAGVVTIPDPEGGYRAAAERVRLPDGTFIVSAAVSLHNEEEVLDDARLAVLIAIPVALLLSALGGWLLARRSLAPMVTMRERAQRISATSLRERLPISNPHDEVGELAAVINDLLGRLEHAFNRQRQFMADASHELRTPVAVVQHEASLALSRASREPEEYRDSLGIVRDAGRRMRLLVDDLFLLANADAGEAPLRRAPLYLEDVVEECARAVRALASSRGISIRLLLQPDSTFFGDEALLHRLVMNLLDNAIKYSPAGAAVTLRLVGDVEMYRLDVEDTGPGIPPAVQPHVFERFIRADQARSHTDAAVSGAGLGLAIARWIAEAHRGRLELVSSSSRGTTFRLTLPRASG